MSLPLERHLARQSIALLLYSRRYGRVSSSALDILASLLSELLFQLGRRTNLIANLQDNSTANFCSTARELLRCTRSLYISLAELMDFARESMASDNGKFWEDRPIPPIKPLARRNGQFLIVDEKDANAITNHTSDDNEQKRPPTSSEFMSTEGYNE